MANEVKKVKMVESRGNPVGGAIIRAGATVDLPAFWADRYVADGSAELVSKNLGEGTATPPKTSGKGGKGK